MLIGKVVLWFCLVPGFPKLRKMKALDLSSNNFSGSMGLEGKSKHILCYSIKTGGELMFTHVYLNLHLISVKTNL